MAWIAIALVETLQGFLRIQFLVPRVGDVTARQMGVFTGSALIFGVAWLSTRWIGVRSTRQLLQVGVLWLVLMLVFEITLGRLVFDSSWARIFSDYDPRQGGLLGIGMAVLTSSPCLATRCRGIHG